MPPQGRTTLHTAYRTRTLSLSCHSEPSPQTGRGNPYPPFLPPSQREVSRPKAVTEGEICRGSAAAYGAMWASPPTHRLPHPHFVLILSFRASAHTGVGIRIPAPAGAESPKPPLCKGRCRPQGDGGSVIAGRGRAPPLHTFIETCTHDGVWSRRPTNYLRRQNIPNQRPKAATYLCRFAAKARFDNRQPPEGVSKEGGPQPSLFGRSRMGDFQGGRKIETSFPLEWRFWLLLSLLTKVTRRRQKKYSGRTEPRPYIPSAPQTHQDLRPRRRSCPQFSYNISRATGR